MSDHRCLLAYIQSFIYRQQGQVLRARFQEVSFQKLFFSYCTLAVTCRMGQCVLAAGKRTPTCIGKHRATSSSTAFVSPSAQKSATNQELLLVLDHFEAAQKKDIEAILKEHEPHVLTYRDDTYCQALRDGITSESDMNTRLAVLLKVMEFLFMNIEPPNHYTKVRFVTNSSPRSAVPFTF